MSSLTIIYLILCYYISNSICTNLLPLEVFEISSAVVQQQQQQKQQLSQQHNIFNNNIINNNNSNNLTNINSNNTNTNSNSNNNNNNINLLKTIYNNLNNKINKNSNNINNNYNDNIILPLLNANKIKLLENNRKRSSRQMTIQQQQQQQQQKLLLNDELLIPHRILYQIGESEEDLPICAPNAVCSKIDVYDIPWIERQCRCPTIYTNKIQIHHHHHHNHHHNNNNPNQNLINPSKHINSKLTLHNNQKYNLPQRHLFDINGKKVEDIHIKKFMQKLQAVHRDDLIISENDLQPNEQITKNTIPMEQQKLQQQLQQQLQKQQNLFLFRKVFRQISQMPVSGSIPVSLKNRESNKLRHSGHFGQLHHHRREISFLGGCPSDIRTDDGFTISDKTRHYKLCSPVHKLPLCNSFTDFTWTVTTMPELNVTEQIVHCRCRPNSVTYLTKWEPNNHSGYTYYFACSPQNRLRCQRKEPCRLFTVRERQEHLDEVNTNPLCQCPRDHKCPTHHTDSGVVAGESYMDDNIKTYAGYCMTND